MLLVNGQLWALYSQHHCSFYFASLFIRNFLTQERTFSFVLETHLFPFCLASHDCNRHVSLNMEHKETPSSKVWIFKMLVLILNYIFFFFLFFCRKSNDVDMMAKKQKNLSSLPPIQVISVTQFTKRLLLQMVALIEWVRTNSELNFQNSSLKPGK